MSSVRHNQKHSSLKFALFVSLLALVGAAFVADLLWTSSSSSTLFAFRYVTDSWSVSYSPTLNLPNSSYSSQSKVKGKDQGKNIPAGRILSATFADLPGPEPHWEKLPTAPVPRLDEAAIQIKNLLYVFAGYGNINAVHSHVDIFNFTNTWGESFPMPKEMAHSHLVVTDGRYIYVVTGQYGPQCRGPTARNFVLDTDTKQWKDLLLCQSLDCGHVRHTGIQILWRTAT